ncbi:hypothetical protein MJG53_011717 [Ovis ammon polii x Ovis aries]|uniref:Uncharacterized protein n=1 Tax=Ovis ammon polii x Ovis aries TaxID=2918886 RepID=A0ACB9UQ48_9CETA|nr:hypothetical protein MJG53_011717 [Ovis ammon polii x Ovis aries]
MRHHWKGNAVKLKERAGFNVWHVLLGSQDCEVKDNDILQKSTMHPLNLHSCDIMNSGVRNSTKHWKQVNMKDETAPNHYVSEQELLQIHNISLHFAVEKAEEMQRSSAVSAVLSDLCELTCVTCGNLQRPLVASTHRAVSDERGGDECRGLPGQLGSLFLLTHPYDTSGPNSQDYYVLEFSQSCLQSLTSPNNSTMNKDSGEFG